jgi:glycosyltransferase involved in cell wall biosynthesis
VLVVHNYYQQPGGEDEVFRAEVELLRARGHEVVPFTLHNDAIASAGRLGTAVRTVWNRDTARALRELCRERRPAIAHFHNTFPLVSPAAYYAVRRSGAAVVQTLHNFRLLCANALFYRDGRPCEDCLAAALPWPGVVHACYRGSRAASAVTAAMLTVHRGLGTYARAVDAYIALSEFARRKFVAGGLPEDRVTVKPNFLARDPGLGGHRGGYALFVGRLAPEKGLETLLAAWKMLGARYPLKIVGQGPLEPMLREPPAGVEWLGWRPREEVTRLMQDAAVLILPSTWYEHFPMTLVEAYATGLPVIGSKLGSVAELVREGETGEHFRPADPRDLARVAEELLGEPERLARLGAEARRTYEGRYTAARNYDAIAAVYEAARARRARATSERLT